jgi:hypothetical protein
MASAWIRRGVTPFVLLAAAAPSASVAITYDSHGDAVHQEWESMILSEDGATRAFRAAGGCTTNCVTGHFD